MRKGERKPKRTVGDPNDPDGLGVWMLRYLEWLRVRAFADRTVENRERALGIFIDWLAARSITRPVEVTKLIIERYQRHLYLQRKTNGKPLTFRSQHALLVPVRGYFKWLTRQNVILSNPASEMDLPRLDRRLPQAVLTAAEAEAVLAEADVRRATGLRDRAILETFYSTGIRRMELIRLQLHDLDAERGTVMVRQGKGRRDRMIPIGARAVAWITKYLGDVRPELVVDAAEAALFLTHLGEPFTEDHLTSVVRAYVRKADIGKRGACHLFRHTMATLMLEGGADVRFVQEMLGHASLDTTQIYTHVAIRQLKQVHTMTHPAARLEPRKAETAAGADDDEREKRAAVGTEPGPLPPGEQAR